MIEMSVIGLGMDGAKSVVLLSDEQRNRALPIFIGALEAKAISRAVTGLKSNRPTTHELLLNTINELGFGVHYVEIDIRDEQTYFAKVQLTPLREELPVKEIEARPSDAIAIALASAAPIMVSSEVMARAGIAFETVKEDEDTDQFKAFLNDVKASDFRLPGFEPGSLPEE
jgi:bifunctional DNase/RNase